MYTVSDIERRNAFTIEVAKEALVAQNRQKKNHEQSSANNVVVPVRGNTSYVTSSSTFISINLRTTISRELDFKFKPRNSSKDQRTQRESSIDEPSSMSAQKGQETPSRSALVVKDINPRSQQMTRQRQKMLPGPKSPRPQRTRKPAFSALKNFEEKYESE